MKVSEAELERRKKYYQDNKDRLKAYQKTRYGKIKAEKKNNK